MSEYELNPREQRFADEYIANGRNATQAYKKISPSAKDTTCAVSGCKLLKEENVITYIKKREAKILAEIEDRKILIDERVYNYLLERSNGRGGMDGIVNFLLERTMSNVEEADDWLRINKRNTISTGSRYSVFLKAGFKCEACGDSPKVNDECILHVDHIIPFSIGGIDNITNYQCLCARCNISKGNRYAIDNRK